MLAKKL